MKWKINAKFNLMSKLLSSFILLIIVCTTVIGALSYNSAKESLQNEAESKLKTVLTSTVQKIEMQEKSISNQVKILSGLSEISNYVEQSNIGRNDIKKQKSVESIVADYKKSIVDICENVFVTDLKGNILIDSNNGSSKGLNVSEREYFKSSILGNESSSDVLSSSVTKLPIVVYSQPLKASNGNVLGTINAAIKFEALSKILSGVKVGETGYIYMIDKQGLTLYHPDTSSVFKENMKESSRENKDLNNIIANMIQGKEDSGFYSYEGKEKYVTYKPFKNWSIAINIPVEEYMTAAYNIRTRTMIIALISIIIATIIAVIVSRSITNPIINLMSLMKKAEEGDLTIKSQITSRDEIGELSKSFNNMLEAQRKVIHEVLSVAKDVENSSKTISEASEEMAASSENQTSSSEELTATMTEMSKSIIEVSNGITDISSNINSVTYSMEEMSKASNEMSKRVEETTTTFADVIKGLEEMNASIAVVANNSKNASAEAEKTVNVAKNGKEAVGNTIIEMDKTTQVVNNLTVVINGLGKAAVQIGEIVEVIDDIAEQTNLLALNASIEAARAGEHGKGFAVVANAIGNLAEKSGEATKDITKLIKKIQDEVQFAINTTEDGATQVQSGVALVKNTGVAFDEIFEAIGKTTEIINEIAKATLEQSNFSKSMMAAVEKVNELSHNSSALAEEQNATVEEVLIEIEKINELSQLVASTAEEQSASSEEVLATSESVCDMASEVSTGAEELAQTAEEMAKQAYNMIEVVSTFKVE